VSSVTGARERDLVAAGIVRLATRGARHSRDARHGLTRAPHGDVCATAATAASSAAGASGSSRSARACSASGSSRTARACSASGSSRTARACSASGSSRTARACSASGSTRATAPTGAAGSTRTAHPSASTRATAAGNSPAASVTRRGTIQLYRGFGGRFEGLRATGEHDQEQQRTHASEPSAAFRVRLSRGQDRAGNVGTTRRASYAIGCSSNSPSSHMRLVLRRCTLPLDVLGKLPTRVIAT